MQPLCILNNCEDLSILLQLYQATYPRNWLGCNTLRNFIQWLEREPDLPDIHIYTLDEHWREHGVYLIVDRYQLFVNALRPGDELLGAAMKMLDWSRGYKITSIHESHYPMVMRTLSELGVPRASAGMNVYRLSKSEALKWRMSCPSGYEMSYLRSADAKMVDESWAPRQKGSVAFMERLIDLNVNVSIRKEDTQELVAWCTRCQCGFLGTLHVVDEYRRFGLAKKVIHQFVQELASSGEDVYVLVYVHNQPSNNLFQKLNFELFDHAYHVKAYNVSEDMIGANYI